jgi:hypothetical protein
MEGNPGKRLIAPRPRMLRRGSPAMCGLCQRGVARGAYTRSDSQAAFRRQQACLAVLDQMRPCGRSSYLSATTTETFGRYPIGIRLEDGAVVELGQNGAGA